MNQSYSVDFSFIILTYNEEIHIRRLLESIKELHAPIFILDSGSTDQTLNIAAQYRATVLVNPFETHPKQWDFALQNFDVHTPWVVCLDADQEVSVTLRELLRQFSDNNIPQNVDGIFLNRHNYFRGRRLKWGGYRNKYLLKMFRLKNGCSDLNENMDHKFVVKGDTLIWKKGIIKEENLKENEIDFWSEKHLRYSTQVANEEIERMAGLRQQSTTPGIFGNPDQRIAFLKRIWWKLPLYSRPFLYFFIRFIVQGGIFDGKEGRLFHFLQAFWFRLLVDVKIDELRKSRGSH